MFNLLNTIFTKTSLSFLTQSLWRDEAFTYSLSQQGFGKILFYTAKDFNPPLYYLLIKIWVYLFGKSEIALRSVSLIFYMATLFVVFLILSELFRIGLKKKFIYLLYVAINPVLVFYAFEARMYSMLAFFVAFSFFLLIKKNSRLYIIAVILGLYTHYFMIFVWLGQVIYLKVYPSREKRHWLYYAIPIMVFLPWALFVLFQKNSSVYDPFWISLPQIQNLLNLPIIFLTGVKESLLLPYTYLSVIVCIVISLIVIRLSKMRIRPYYEKRSNLILLVIWAFFTPIIVFMVSFIKPLFLIRYFVFSVFGFLILMIYILERVKNPLRNIILSFLFIVTLYYHQQTVISQSKTDLRRKIREIKKLANEKDLLYVSDVLDFFTAQYYFDENRVYIYGKAYKELPNYVGKVLIPQHKIALSLPLYPRKAFILKNNGDYNIQAIY